MAEKAEKKARNEGANPNSGFIHRGYWCSPKGHGWHCAHKLKRLFPALPTAFHWHLRDDRGGLAAYIDAWYSGNMEVTANAEKHQRATAVEFMGPEEATKDGPRVSVNINRLLDCLQLRDVFDVPLWGKVTFTTDGNRLVPGHFIAALARHFPERFPQLDPKQEWRFAKQPDLDALQLQRHEVTSGMYLGEPAAGAPTAAEPGMPPPAPPPPERTIRRLDRGDWIDWITEVRGGEQRWFTRRCYRESEIFYEATAWSIDGPWYVTLRNTSVMLALGVTL